MLQEGFDQYRDFYQAASRATSSVQGELALESCPLPPKSPFPHHILILSQPRSYIYNRAKPSLSTHSASTSSYQQSTPVCQIMASTTDQDITRCVCGFQTNPGPPVLGQFHDPDFYVGCEKCKVWQHGGCLGMEETGFIPKHYFCEKCKPQYHRIQVTSTG